MPHKAQLGEQRNKGGGLGAAARRGAPAGGRLEMQDAVTMTFGQESHAYAAGLEGGMKLRREAENSLYDVNMGATAIGTGINVSRGCVEKCAEHPAQLTGLGKSRYRKKQPIPFKRETLTGQKPCDH